MSDLDDPIKDVFGILLFSYAEGVANFAAKYFHDYSVYTILLFYEAFCCFHCGLSLMLSPVPLLVVNDPHVSRGLFLQW